MRTKKTSVGLACLPTGTSYDLKEPARSPGFVENHIAYLLEAVDPDQPHAHVTRVVVTASEPIEGWEPGAVVQTKHARGKQLPDRKVIGLFQDGQCLDGDAEFDRHPHWSLFEQGDTEESVLERIKARRGEIEAAKKAAAESKKAAKKTAA